MGGKGKKEEKEKEKKEEKEKEKKEKKKRRYIFLKTGMKRRRKKYVKGTTDDKL